MMTNAPTPGAHFLTSQWQPFSACVPGALKPPSPQTLEAEFRNSMHSKELFFFFLTTVKLVKCDWENRIIIWENK